MNHYQNTPPDKDPKLWEMAQRRVAFRYHLASYIVVNIFFWVLWYITAGKDGYHGVPWPVWPLVGWGIGLVFHYLGAFVFSGMNSVEKEYEKLANRSKS